MIQNILDIPGYREALEKERVIRASAMLGLNETIAGFEVVPLSLWHYEALKVTKNPLIVGGEVTAENLIAFLWLLSPHYSQDNFSRERFVRESGLHLPRLPFLHTRKAMDRWGRKAAKVIALRADALKEAREYVDEALAEMPPSISRGWQPPYYSESASVCGHLGREYGWTQDYVIHLPMKCIYQYFNEIKAHHGSSVPMFNPSDKKRSEWLESQNAALNRN